MKQTGEQMGKRERARRMKDEGLHEIKNKYRIRAVKKKKKGLVMTAKKRRRMLKAGASLSAIFVVILGAFAIGSAFLANVVPNAVPDDFVTVTYALPSDGSKPSDHSALENIGYMNYRFKNQPKWYAEMHGSTVSMGIAQSVNTIKQYSDGVLIMADVTSSSMVKAGRQFCYVGNEVMWRELPKSSSYKMDSYDDMLALTFNDELEAHMTIPAFMKKNGLPGTEMSVYVINEKTLDHASEVERVDSAEWDGKDFAEKPVYRQTYYLRPGDTENLGAAAHYMNQMAFTGGLTGLPSFKFIEVTYTFDSSWQLLRAEVDEAYQAQVGITVNCTSEFKTDYEYGTDRTYNPVYEDYYKDLVGKDIEDNVEKPLDSLGLITSAFLTKPVTFSLDLEVNGRKAEGIVSLDASRLDLEAVMAGGSPDIAAALGGIGLKAKIGEICLYLEDSAAYLSVGDLKARLSVKDLLGLIGGSAGKPQEQNAKNTAPDGEGEKTAPLFDMGDPAVSEDGTRASVSAKLNLSSLGVDLIVPLDFKFMLDEQKNASLESLDLSADYEGIKAKIHIGSTQKSVPELTDRESYVELYPYAEAVYDLIAGKKIAIGLNYENADLSLSGNIGIDFTDGLLAAGVLTLNVRGAEKTVGLAVKEGVAYVDLDGIKLSAAVKDAAALVKKFLPALSVEDAQESGIAAIVDRILSAVFDNDLASLLSLGEEENVLTVGLKGTELLKAFGVDFALGDVRLTVNGENGAICASVFGAEITIKAPEEEITADTAGYTDIMPYVQSLIGIFGNKTFNAEISYTKENVGGKTLGISGNLAFSLSPAQVSGEITVTYGALEKSVKIAYGADGNVYLAIDSFKAKVNVKDAAALVSSLLSSDGESGAAKADIYAVLQKILSVDFGELLAVSEIGTEEGNFLQIAVDGTKLMNLLGIDGIALEDITLTVGNGVVSASASGVGITLAGGGEVENPTEEEKKAYVDLMPVIELLPDILDKKAISLGGSVVLSANQSDYLFRINRGYIRFADGIEAYLDASLVLSGTTLRLEIFADSVGLKIAFGNVGAEIAYADFPSLGDALFSLYAQLREIVNPVLDQQLLPEIRNLNDLLNLLSSQFGGAEGEGFALDGLLSQISIENSVKENGLLALKFMGVTLDLVREADGVGVLVSFLSGKLTAEGNLSAAVYREEKFPSMPNIDYLDRGGIAELLDYLSAALNTLSESSLNFELKGQIGSEDTVKYPEGVKYNLSGDIRLYTGENTLVHLELDKKNLWVDTDTYLYAKVGLEPVLAEDKGIYVEFFLLDCDENGNADGVLDMFVSLSLRKNGTASDPLTLYAPADKIMPILASAVSFVGLDSGVLSDYVVAPWISSSETQAQLKGFGKSILEMIGGLTGGFANTNGNHSAGFDPSAMISSLTVGENSFEIALDSETLSGKKGAPLTVVLQKEQTESGSRLCGLSLRNVGGASVSLGIGYEKREKKTPSFKGMIPMDGIASLLQTLARSTTHAANPEEIVSGEADAGDYILNKNFYIDGSIKLDIDIIDVISAKLNINVVAFSITIDKDGVWGVNVRFEYSAMKKVGIAVINGNTQVDLTGKDNMVYIKRVQTSDADGKEKTPEIIYRAMPLGNFVSDLINQAGFLFNLGDTVKKYLPADMGSSSGSAEETDLGATIRNLLKSIEYTNTKGIGESWIITLNGAGLTNNTLGDIVVTLGADSKGLLRTLTAHTSLSTTGVSLKLDANLTYRNPCGVMDAGVKDITTDIAALLTEGMNYKLGSVDWNGTKFIEGTLTTVDYLLMGEVIKSQGVVLSSGNDGFAKGEVYGALVYPDLTQYDTVKGYKPEWTAVYEAGDPLPASRQIIAVYNPCTYRLTFELNGETVTADYLYGDKGFALPFRADESERIAYFTDAEGGVYRTAEDLKKIGADCTLRAVYEKIPYTVTFVLGGEVLEETYHYGDAIAYPASPEKLGYTFAGWDVMPERVTENLTVTAQWTANEYTVTLVSRFAIEGYDWTANADGTLSARFTFTYDSETAIPHGMKAEENDKTFVLRGFCFENGGECFFGNFPNITENTVFVAEWQELGFDLVFVGRDGTEKTLNYHGGENVPASAIPAIPVRDGYTGVWTDSKGSVVTDGYYVTGEERFTVSDTPNTYLITLMSDHPYAGFEGADGVYTKLLTYTYDGVAVTLDALGDIGGYWFKGFYTQKNGAGEKVDSLDKLLSDTTVYVWWLDNTVTVRVYSDIAFSGSTADAAKNGYYKEYTFNDHYDLDDSLLPTVEGYQTLALWRRTENGYEKVTNVRNMNGEELWVLWIKNLKVTVTQLYLNDYMGGSRYNIVGTLEGGQVFGNKSLEIFGANGTESMTAIIDVKGATADSKNGELDWGGTLDIQYDADGIAKFELLNQNCFNYADGWGKGRATYGGAIVIKTFNCGGETVTTTSGSFRSIDAYTVTYRDENGKEIGKVEGVHIDCPFPYVKDGVSYDFDDRVFADTLAAKNNIAVPEKAGYTGAWAHEEIRGAGDYYPVYTANPSVKVCFESAAALEGFTEENGKYYYEYEMLTGTVVSFYYETQLLNAYTVGEHTVISVPLLSDAQKWGSVDITAEGAVWRAERNVDAVAYSSEVSFLYDGVVYDSLTQEVTDGYTLIQPSAEGYVFLGWYTFRNGVWSKAESIAPTAGADKAVTYVQALWVSEFYVGISNLTHSTSGLLKKNVHGATATVNGGVLKGAFADSASAELSVRFYASNDANYAGTDNGSDRVADYRGSYSKEFSYTFGIGVSKKSHGHIVAALTFSYAQAGFSLMLGGENGGHVYSTY